jgi:hypothetical protein
MTLQNSSAQTLDKYVDQLYFGMLSRNIDTTIRDFITKYAPVVFKKNDGKWTAYPPDTFIEPKFETVINSFVFYTHPYFNAHFKSGQFAITQKIYNDSKWIDNITDINLWFEFDDGKEAKNAYQKLIDTFSSFHVLKRVTAENGIDKAEFTDKNSDKYYSHVQILFAKDYFIQKKYLDGFKIITTTGYKILIETGNDLYQ